AVSGSSIGDRLASGGVCPWLSWSAVGPTFGVDAADSVGDSGAMCCVGFTSGTPSGDVGWSDKGGFPLDQASNFLLSYPLAGAIQNVTIGGLGTAGSDCDTEKFRAAA